MNDRFNKKVAKKIEGLNVKDVYNFLARRIKGQHKAIISVAVYVMKYLEAVANNKEIPANIIITAPSGCGKTETYRAINEMFLEKEIPIPVIQIDTTDMLGGKSINDIAAQIIDSMIDVENRGLVYNFNWQN